MEGLATRQPRQGGTLLLERAVMKHRFQLARRLIDCGQYGTLTTRSQTVVLMELVRCGRYTLVEQLLNQGADANASEGTTCALTVAAYKGAVHTVENLLRHGANPNQGDKWGSTPLLLATHHRRFPVIDLLLQHGADINQANRSGMNPLLIAAMTGDEEAVKGLVERGANVNFVGQYAATPLMRAAQGGHLNVVKYLIEAGADLQASNNVGTNALYNAVTSAHPETVSFLLSQGISTKGILGHSCACFWVEDEGFADAVQLLVDAGVDLEERVGLNQGTALHAACRSGHTVIVKLLIDAGANVNASDKTGATPLFHAAGSGHIGCIRALIDADADASIRDKQGYTALRVARQQGHHAAAGLLRKRTKACPVTWGETSVTPVTKQEP